SLFSSSCAALPFCHSFPTRRSSDLLQLVHAVHGGRGQRRDLRRQREPRRALLQPHGALPHERLRAHERVEDVHVLFRSRLLPVRSEEHTSELQSRENLVCRLLLEKK